MELLKLEEEILPYSGELLCNHPSKTSSWLYTEQHSGLGLQLYTWLKVKSQPFSLFQGHTYCSSLE